MRSQSQVNSTAKGSFGPLLLSASHSIAASRNRKMALPVHSENSPTICVRSSLRERRLVFWLPKKIIKRYRHTQYAERKPKWRKIIPRKSRLDHKDEPNDKQAQNRRRLLLQYVFHSLSPTHESFFAFYLKACFAQHRSCSGSVLLLPNNRMDQFNGGGSR